MFYHSVFQTTLNRFPQLSNPERELIAGWWKLELEDGDDLRKLVKEESLKVWKVKESDLRIKSWTPIRFKNISNKNDCFEQMQSPLISKIARNIKIKTKKA